MQLKPEYIRKLSPDERKKLLKEQQELFVVEKAHRARGEDHRQMRNIRKNIARLKTIMHEYREL